jgi:hypothetical protein
VLDSSSSAPSVVCLVRVNFSLVGLTWSPTLRA